MDRDLFVADRGSGPPVLAIHGQPGLAADWDALLPFLEDHRVLVVDRPGYGRSGGEPLDMATNAELLAELLVERGAAPATVVGHSYGGGIAILLAARHPELVSGLVLVGSVGRADSVNVVDHALALPIAGEALTAAGLITFGRILPRLRGLVGHLPGGRREWLEASLPDRRFAEVASRYGRQISRSFVAEQRTLLREISDIEAALALVAVPTVVITGTWDVVVPPSVATSIAATIAGSELVTVARTGHFVPRDAPEVVARAVRDTEQRSAAGPTPRAEPASEGNEPGA
jgi:pimeloyl-ACP methyl ester carboxylesterase